MKREYIRKVRNLLKPALNQGINPAGRAGKDKPNSETGITMGERKASLRALGRLLTTLLVLWEAERLFAQRFLSLS